MIDIKIELDVLNRIAAHLEYLHIEKLEPFGYSRMNWICELYEYQYKICAKWALRVK